MRAGSGGSMLIALLVSSFAHAVPLELVHQGRILDELGDPLTGDVPVKFLLYDVPTGGTPLWEEDHVPSFDDGWFSVRLGEDDAFDLDDFDSVLYLAIQVEQDAELAGRVPLASVP